jgi:hypothetical protein
VAIDLHTGEVYTGAAGKNPQIASSGPFTHVGETGNLVGTTPLSIPFDGNKTTILAGSKSSMQYFYEGSLDVATVGGAGALAGIHWTMSCGNDVGEGWDRITTVPEPASFAILGIGFLWMTGLRRRLRAAWEIDSSGQTRTLSGRGLRSLLLDFCRSRLTSRRPQP